MDVYKQINEKQPLKSRQSKKTGPYKLKWFQRIKIGRFPFWLSEKFWQFDWDWVDEILRNLVRKALGSP